MGTSEDLYEVEIIISSMEDVGELIEEREGREEEANDDPVSIELVELKARALRCNTYIPLFNGSCVN